MEKGYSFIRRNPFIKLCLPFCAGILLQWNLGIDPLFLAKAIIITGILLVVPEILKAYYRFRFRMMYGILVCFLFIILGALAIALKDIRQQKTWLGNNYSQNDSLYVRLLEPLTEKKSSFKTVAEVRFIPHRDSMKKVNGRIIIYFEKDSSLTTLNYGSILAFNKRIRPVNNTGNPGSFDYWQYCFFQGISHQVYLKKNEFLVSDKNEKKWFTVLILDARKKILRILRSNTKDEKSLGLAEALLIGYKNDLDKQLLQSYSNTGVVHVIAISGLHLGIIYVLLLQLFKPLRNKKNTRWLASIIIIAVLWLFSILSGAGPSVLRSVLMFSCIIIGETIARRTSIINSICFSAFVLLCYNPYWLWDAGFQLSYSAVLSIVIFMKPVYNIFYFKNKLIDNVWKLQAVTIAAQLLTTPVSLFHFHQFPNFFLITNLVAVPLSSIILIAGITLCVFYPLPSFGQSLGNIISNLIHFMNTYIERIETIPFSTWTGINISIAQALFLYLALFGVSIWMLDRIKAGIYTALVSILAFLLIRDHSFKKCEEQEKLIVYNINRQLAVEVISGRNFHFIGDNSAIMDKSNFDYHIKGSRIHHRLKSSIHQGKYGINCSLKLGKNNIFILREGKYNSTLPVDILVLGRNADITLNTDQLLPGLIVVAPDVAGWKARNWSVMCNALGIKFHDVKTQGAFVKKFR